ncbi:MAG: hypothetical protein J3R72DRAFT_417400 [Linnemannia gamsii]|nr:MAG: hypothetical protein J3R72DRAFT_417400 [Linnemannia gamsii]
MKWSTRTFLPRHAITFKRGWSIFYGQMYSITSCSKHGPVPGTISSSTTCSCYNLRPHSNISQWFLKPSPKSPSIIPRVAWSSPIVYHKTASPPGTLVRPIDAPGPDLSGLFSFSS